MSWPVWFYKDWYLYLLAEKSEEDSWIKVIWCRMHGHPAGVIWYNSSGYEPNMTCKGCGDDLDR